MDKRVKLTTRSAMIGGVLLAITLITNGGTGVAAPQAVLHDQLDNGIGTGWIGSTNFLNNASYDSLDSQGADDFLVPSDEIWQISTVTLDGLYTGSTGTTVPQSVLVQFYGNGGGNLPGVLLYSTTIAAAQVTGLESGDFVLTLPNSPVLGPGRYWLSVQANKQVDGIDGYQWHWRERSVQAFSPSAWRNPGDGYGTTCTTFRPRINECDHPGNSVNPDLLFRLDGTPIDINTRLILPIVWR